MVIICGTGQNQNKYMGSFLFVSLEVDKGKNFASGEREPDK